ncbi:MAG: hypothetical protein AAGB29_02290 [Planctomycetota bacterium]
MGVARGWALCVACLVLASACATGPASTGDADVAEIAWERLDNLPVAVFNTASSVSGRRWIVTGGIRSDVSAAREVQSFDLDTRTWALGEPLAEGRFNHAQATLPDGRVLVVGGQQFDPENRYRALASCELIEADGDGVSAAASLPEAMAFPTLTSLPDGRLVAVGGRIASVYDPQRDAWGEGIALRESRGAHAAVALPSGQEVVVIGGNRRRIEVVEVDAGRSVALAASLPHALDDLEAVLLPDGRVWVIGGQRADTGRTIDDTYILDLGDPGPPRRPSRVTLGPQLKVAEGVADHRIATLPDGRLVMVGGESDTESGDIELTAALLLDPRELSVTRLANTLTPHDDATAVADGWRVYATAGIAPNRAFGVRLPPMPVATAEALDLSELSRTGGDAAAGAP